ncbi:UvrD-helicase domain-containing protein [Clostridium perfringens]|uniref:ATP-dependent helicase n=1 Tax=Clostridium perfringens TaxID=1502 RepID=UPI00016698F9|nr:ATP-dependent helicase [Clostridium perfringens]EDS78880.1 DNA helicase II [Clostridium perfringens C str. JGS1495]MDJ8958821.1 ATP-dependent helicase [Clostridium perfringens]MDY4419388.1 ATP-dependent helicase [Clostridium perfringens]NGT75260.1 ATP-dependent helicase [Clostridium perfringens]PWX24083.1 ATP-dependent helicase [Clostridium perfringens]
MKDNEIREEILSSDDNMIILAGAGSGKTTLLTNKIIDYVEKTKTHYKIAAITFTNKATNEIKLKLKGKINGNFIGNNDSFVEQEIIRPFLNDAYGEDYSNDFIVTYKTNKFNFYNEGLKVLKDKNILASYEDNKKNFKFELALNILELSKVARQYIKAKYSRIFIDEYQDCDKDMHNLFMYIKELGVKLFIVGDTKQSIYSWRGANPKLFEEIYIGDNDFKKYELFINFRCSKGIQNYSNIIQYRNIDKYQDNNEDIDDVILLSNNYDINDAVNTLDIEESIAILVRSNAEAETIKNELNLQGYNFTFVPKTPLDELSTNNKNILIELAKYSKDKVYTHYDFVSTLPGDFSRKEILSIKEIIQPLKLNLEKDKIEDILINLFAFLNLSFFETKEIDSFVESIINTRYENAFNGEEFIHKVMTIHSSKGLEFEQVVICSKNYNLFIGKDSEEHYVATTRAKKKLVILLNDTLYLKKIKCICRDTGLILEDIAKFID